MIEIRHERFDDVPARERLLDACFGADRRAKTSERLREGRLPAEGLSFVCECEGRLVGTLRMWEVTAGPGRAALLLGPLAVEPTLQGLGIGARLTREALSRAAELGHRAVLLVGDASYYARFGFSGERTGTLWLPGPYDPARFQALELAQGALARAAGLVQPTGRRTPVPDFDALVAAARSLRSLAA